MKNKKLKCFLCYKRKVFSRATNNQQATSKMSDGVSNYIAKEQQQHHTEEEPVVYEMFIPFLYRGKDKEATERRVFWVFKQLNWGFIKEVRVYGFDDESKKNVTARISFTRINATASELIAQLDAGETAQVHYEQGKPWFWNVVKYTRREPKAPSEPQVTFKIKVKQQPPQETQTVVIKPTANKFKVLPVEASESDSDEAK